MTQGIHVFKVQFAEVVRSNASVLNLLPTCLVGPLPNHTEPFTNVGHLRQNYSAMGEDNTENEVRQPTSANLQPVTIDEVQEAMKSIRINPVSGWRE